MSCEALLQTAMEMYDLEHFEILHEELLETRVPPLDPHRPPVMLPERLLCLECWQARCEVCPCASSATELLLGIGRC